MILLWKFSIFILILSPEIRDLTFMFFIRDFSLLSGTFMSEDFLTVYFKIHKLVRLIKLEDLCIFLPED